VTCPQCGQGEIVEKRTRFGLFYGCDRYPECDFAVNNPPVKDHPCPECGSLLVERPKSYRCWNCGAELDKDFAVTKPGDPEAEAAARAAKAKARAERAKARSAKRSTSKRSSAKSNGAKRTVAKRTAAKRTTATKAAATSAPSGGAPAAGDAEG
jgi:DNA topoisomerase-1